MLAVRTGEGCAIGIASGAVSGQPPRSIRGTKSKHRWGEHQASPLEPSNPGTEDLGNHQTQSGGSMCF